jgi:hypothetical protein
MVHRLALLLALVWLTPLVWLFDHYHAARSPIGPLCWSHGAWDWPTTDRNGMHAIMQPMKPIFARDWAYYFRGAGVQLHPARDGGTMILISPHDAQHLGRWRNRLGAPAVMQMLELGMLTDHPVDLRDPAVWPPSNLGIYPQNTCQFIGGAVVYGLPWPPEWRAPPYEL